LILELPALMTSMVSDIGHALIGALARLL